MALLSRRAFGSLPPPPAAMSFQTKGAVVVSGAGGSTPAVERSYGLSPVISFKGPTEQESRDTAVLRSILTDRHLFETDAQAEEREVALGALNELVQEWMVAEGMAAGVLDPSVALQPAAEVSPGKLYTFGSFRLGVNGPGADIDTLVVGPSFVSRQSFFEKFPAVLEQRKDLVTDLTVRIHAHTSSTRRETIETGREGATPTPSSGDRDRRPLDSTTPAADCSLILFLLFRLACLPLFVGSYRRLCPRDHLQIPGHRVRFAVRADVVAARSGPRSLVIQHLR